MAGETAPPAPEPPPVRAITLHHNQHNDSTLYRFEKGYTIRFYPGPSLLGRKVFLYTNYVVSDDQFVRTQYFPLQWRRGGSRGEGGEALGAGELLDDTDCCCELRLARAGPFHYYFVYDAASCPAGPQGSGWFQVAPTLTTGDVPLPLDAVLCQTVLAKCLGPLPRWLGVLRVAREAGYNMLHFSPVQQLGASNSSYSIANQLKINPRFSADSQEATFADVENIVSHIRKEWKMLSICDIVLNHTANETPWLLEHPEATYNVRDCPHLRPAALLDAALAALTADVGRGALAHRGVPARVTAHEHIEALRSELEVRVRALRLEQLAQCRPAELCAAFAAAARRRPPPPAPLQSAAPPALQLTPDPQGRRFHATIDMELALQIYNVHRAECGDEESRVSACTGALRAALGALNDAAAAHAHAQLRAAVDNCLAGMRYFRLQADGPRIAEVSETHPLVPRYFTWPAGIEQMSTEQVESVVWGAEGARVMAHNGWVMGAEPLADFAGVAGGGRVYLRRELIAWGDSVKLRYGAAPSDSPFLWRHMREYVELTAEIFDGVRLDNCHSTPIHVAEYLLDCARSVRPELYVVAELFTDSDHVDNIFVNRLGITSLVREAQAAWDAHEQGRLVHRYGGRPVGAFFRAAERPAQDSVAHAMLLDLTHDNPSPVEKRCVLDLLPTAALTAMACCAGGSTRGYDELVPHHIHVVDEDRLYPEWDEGGGGGEGRVSLADGILAAKRALNNLHVQLARHGYSEVYVDQMDENTVAVTRQEPRERHSVILVARCAFSAPGPEPPPRALRFEGELVDIVLEAELNQKGDKSESGHVRHPRYITGLAGYTCAVRRGLSLAQSALLAGGGGAGGAGGGGVTQLQWRRLPPGAVLALRVRPAPPAAAALLQLHRALAAPDPFDMHAALANVDLADLNTLLYRCEAEERAAGGGGVYDVPGHGPLVYAGLQGIMSLLDEVRPTDDLGHPLCDNLRNGDWLVEYTWRRLEREGLPGSRVKAALLMLRDVPRYLQPACVDAALSALHAACERAALRRLAAGGGALRLGAAGGGALRLGAAGGGALRRGLALTSVQLLARARPGLPAAPGRPSLAAGLPHFAAGYMRCWGRDTFISLRGLLQLTGRLEDARAHIVGFGACLRHGLIPNLLDGGTRARYNCRDAVWWWLHSIKQYVCEVPEGHTLLSVTVPRLFPTDDAEAGAGDVTQPLHDIMQEALDKHFQGQVFRERNAGRGIDAHMSDAGFTVQFGVCPDTGFVFGGNDHNAGTWMDKMGSSERAGTRGKPATPRDGSAVELVGLSYAVLRWLAAETRYPHKGVTRTQDGDVITWSWAQWADRIQRNFERHFWIPAEAGAADARPDLVHRRGIYKDTHGASRDYADYQLRCNYVLAMAVAPGLFCARRAALALRAVRDHLLGPLGLRTLDPADWAYRPDYDNSDDSDDPSVAHGYNYHQGPEWLWPLGFYLRAQLHFGAGAGRGGARGEGAGAGGARGEVTRALGPLAAELRASPWRALPELSAAGGRPCAHACRSQAWSSAVIIEVLEDLQQAQRATPLA